MIRPTKRYRSQTYTRYAFTSANELVPQGGKPYLRSVVVGKPEEDPRAQGYTLCAKTEFASLEDMKYYDEECPGHQKLKGVAKTLTVEGIMSVYFKPSLVGGATQ